MIPLLFVALASTSAVEVESVELLGTTSLRQSAASVIVEREATKHEGCDATLNISVLRIAQRGTATVTLARKDREAVVREFRFRGRLRARHLKAWTRAVLSANCVAAQPPAEEVVEKPDEVVVAPAIEGRRRRR